MIKDFRQSLSLLATRRFGTFWFASLLSSIGTWAQQVAEPWLLLTLGASAFLVGLDSFAMNAPVWLLTLAGGALADRADRRRVIAGFQSAQMLCPTVIVVLLVAGAARPWMIVALSVIVGVTDALSMPSFQSIVPSIVSPGQIGTGLALNSTQFNLSRVLGPAIAGLLMVSFGATGCFIVSAVSYVPFIGVALWILPRRQRLPPAHESLPVQAGGVTRVLRDRQVASLLLTVALTSLLCAPIVTFSPVLVKDVFRGDAGRFSTVVAAFGIGGLLGAFALLASPQTVDRRRIGAVFALVFGLVVVVTSLNRWFVLLPVLLVVAGAAMTISNTAMNALLQSTARPGLLGQTVSLYMLAMRGGLALGALLTGASANLLGVRRALLINGIVAVVGQALVARWSLRVPGAADRAA